MPATLGRLAKVRLNGIPDTGPSIFKLPNDLASYPAHPAANSPRHLKKLHRQGVRPAQLALMTELVAEYADASEVYDDMTGRSGSLDMEHAVTDAEFLFHGSPTDWDTVYTSGGLRSQGGNTSLGEHVHSSKSAQSAYISGSRELSVAKSFAGNNGWVYLIYAPTGIGVYYNSTHRQAEVAALQCVPVKDLVMCKEMTAPDLIYINKGCRSVLQSAQNLGICLRLIGGGQYPPGQFWTLVP